MREGSAGWAGFWIDLSIVAIAISVSLIAHLVEIAIWALLFVICAEFSAFGPAYHHSAVNYTTSGYGDVIMTPRWRMLGPLEAANGMLMVGVAAAIIFAVIQRMVRSALVTSTRIVSRPRHFANNPSGETRVKIRNSDLSHRDWELCCTYVNEMMRKGLSAPETWELELEKWAANPDRQPSKSTVTKLRLRFPGAINSTQIPRI